jgi:hypothetical protein
MPTSDYRPTVDEVAKRLVARTMEADTGNRVGTFNADTRPTGEEVHDLIDDALTVVSSAVGVDLDAEFLPMAKAATIAYTAMSIEMSYYPETTEAGDSSFRAFKERFAQQVEYIETALNQRRPNERRIVSLRQETTVGSRAGRLDPWASELLP